jgi:hypothetical protein
VILGHCAFKSCSRVCGMRRKGAKFTQTAVIEAYVPPGNFFEVGLRRVYVEEGGLLVQYELPVGPAVYARINVLEQSLWRARLHLDPTND